MKFSAFSNTGKLLLLVVILVICILLLTTIFTGVWLQTYSVFTQKTLVAELEVGDLKSVGQGKQFTVKVKEVKQNSALFYIFMKENPISYTDQTTYTMFGDEIRLGGQVVKFADWANLLGVKTVYKITRIESDYTNSLQQSQLGGSAYDLNGGIDSYYVFLQNNEDKLKFFIDTVEGDYPGKLVGEQFVKYGLYVTEEGFLLERL